MKKILFLSLLIFFTYDSSAQFKEIFKSRREKLPLGINLVMFGPNGLIGISVDYFVTPKLNFEIGTGRQLPFTLPQSYYFGGKYHFFGKTFVNATFYLGIYDAFYYTGTDLRNHSIYIPFGIQRIKKNKFAWSLEVAFQNNINYNSYVWGAAKFGFRFDTRSKKKKDTKKQSLNVDWNKKDK